MENRSLSDVGGTPGGLGHFLIGFAMTCVGGYLLSNQVSVVGSDRSFYGGNSSASRFCRCSSEWVNCSGTDEAFSDGF